MGETVELDGITAYQADGDGPCLVVLHEWWGLVPHIKDMCDRFAALGFTALAPDLYHGETASNTEPDEAEKLLMALDRRRAIAEVAATVRAVRRRGCAKVGTIGFCMGGALSLAASAACPSTRPSPTTASGRTAASAPSRTPSSSTSPSTRNTTGRLPGTSRWFEGMDNAEIHIYPGTQHAFFNDTRPDLYDEAAATLSWDRTVAFFREHLA